MTYYPERIIGFKWCDNDFNSPIRAFLLSVAANGTTGGGKSYWRHIWNLTLPGLYLMHTNHTDYAMKHIEHLAQYLQLPDDSYVFVGLEVDKAIHEGICMCYVDFRYDYMDPIIWLSN